MIELKLKYAQDNVGDLVITDGNSYAGFIESKPLLLAKYYGRWDLYEKYTRDEMNKLEINKITEWSDLPHD